MVIPEYFRRAGFAAVGSPDIRQHSAGIGGTIRTFISGVFGRIGSILTVLDCYGSYELVASVRILCAGVLIAPRMLDNLSLNV